MSTRLKGSKKTWKWIIYLFNLINFPFQLISLYRGSESFECIQPFSFLFSFFRHPHFLKSHAWLPRKGMKACSQPAHNVLLSISPQSCEYWSSRAALLGWLYERRVGGMLQLYRSLLVSCCCFLWAGGGTWWKDDGE